MIKDFLYYYHCFHYYNHYSYYHYHSYLFILNAFNPYCYHFYISNLYAYVSSFFKFNCVMCTNDFKTRTAFEFEIV